MGVEDPVGAVLDADAVEAPLCAHHSTSAVERDEAGTTTFMHDCGSGLALWRRTPDAAKVTAGGGSGVPSGVPRYCVRCITTIGTSAGFR